MTDFALDASALIAMLKGEPGADTVANAISDAKLTAINYAEVVSVFNHAGTPAPDIDAMLRPLPFMFVAADEKLSRAAGQLRAITASAGLSLGDRYCLALAKQENIPAWTTDRQWLAIADVVGVEVRLVR